MPAAKMTSLWGVPLIWVPYVALRLYWHHLPATVPVAAHGEVSVPIKYFLPRLLLVLALIVSAAWLLVLAVQFCRGNTSTE